LPFYAQENGFFPRSGLNVEVSSVAGGGANMAAVAGGAVEIGAQNAGNVVASVLAGLPLTIIADSGLYESQKPTTLLCTDLKSSI
jgi:ABC-type nitrate/sulfonate/bicarbonate transport system substrate-binding protein